MAAARSQVDPYCGSHARDAAWGVELSPAGTVSLLQSSSGVDLAPDSGNALGH